MTGLDAHRFTVTGLGTDPAEVGDGGNFPHMMKKSAGSRVLIVDDEPLIRWSMSETLASDGYLITEAGDARGALEQLSKWPAPDVILLDYRLPDSNDLNLLATIRERTPATPVIVMTAFGAPDVVAGAVKLGAFRVVSKPLDMHEVESLVELALASR
jgi:DNA-binding NtrC family response regulator